MGVFDFSVIGQSWQFLLDGLFFSLRLTAVGFAGGLALGIAIALARELRVPGLSQVLAVYVTLMRAIPLIMVLFWFFFLMPIVLMWVVGASRPVQIGPGWTAYATFTMFEAAYYSEIIRAGLRSIGQGQYAASKALGMTTWSTYRLIILPQAVRVASPILLTQTIILFQDTSLVYVLSATDLLGAASKIAQRDSALVEMYMTVAVVYLVVCFLASQLVAYVKQRYSVPVHR